MEESIKDLIKEISVLDIKPDQTLVIKVNYNAGYEAMKKIQDHVSEYLGCKVLMMDQGMELTVLNIEDKEVTKA